MNKEGFFFQKYCVQKIKESGWIVEAEEYLISKDESFDIKASLILFETALHITVVECKRSDPTRKRWIFFRKEPIASGTEEFLVQTHNLLSRQGSFLRKGMVVRGVFEGLNESKLDFPSCHTVGVELFKEDEKDKREWQTNSQTIFNSCVTVSKGIAHLFDSEAERIDNTLRVGIKTLKKYRMPYFLGGTLIPVIITSAPIYSVMFDPNAIDIKTFKISQENAKYEEKEWLVYEFPLPQELQHQCKDTFSTICENRYAKMYIFIVNGGYIKSSLRHWQKV